MFFFIIGLETHSASRWTSISKVFKSVDAHQPGFKICLETHLNPQINSVKLVPEILSK